MPRNYTKAKAPRYRPKSETEKECRRQEVKAAGGWYSWHKAQREARERQQQEAQARQTNQGHNDRIVTYPQRRYVGEPPQITKGSDYNTRNQS